MKTLFSRLITVIACFFIFSAAWFCLWSISLHLVERPDMAVLLFPFGLRLGLMLQCPRGYWPVLLGAEWLLIYWLTQAVGLTHFPLLMIGSLLTLLPVALISRYRHQRDWRTLLLQGAALTAAALLQSLPWLWHGKESWNALLLTLTGGLTLAPICLVFWHYLANNTWLPLGPSLVSQPINWRGRHLVWYLLLFVISLWLQLGVPDELSRFTPFCLALPIIALAWHYGWQGALIATLMNAIALIASQTWRDHPVDLLLSLLVQSLTGLLLGAGIQRLRELNQSLQKELARNQHLAERLLETEESVRRDVARELHDDIGQTITAIRTQAGIVQRLAADNASVKQSGQLIEQLSLGVYDAVRRLLGRLRPRQLDDLTLEQAIRSLMREMELEPKAAQRKGNSVIYFKQSDRIEDFLTSIGAPVSAMEVMNAKLEKDIRGSVNRRVNCDAANLDKAVEAAMVQLEAIRRLEERGRLALLPDKLKETAALRLAHPEDTLSQLAERCDPPITKSALNHRLRKLVELGREEG